MKKLLILCLALLTLNEITAAQQNYRVLGADKKHVAIVNAKGEVEWEIPNPTAREIHDIQYLPNGNVLFQTGYTTVVEVNKDKEVVWKHESKPKDGYTGRVEIHSYQRLKNGLTMIAESGNGRIIEVDKNDQIVNVIPLKLEKPNAHRDTRMVRPVGKGGYLVCQEGEGKVIEYDKTGKIVWSYALELGDRPRSPGHGVEGHGVEVFGAVRLKNGNTLIAGGNNNRILEVNRAGKIVWSIDHKELPGIQFAWMTTLQVLPNGNIIIGNTHAGPNNPQLIEVTRDKKVVWQFKNWDVFGDNLVAATVINLKGNVIR
ncbi:MAG: PQQ-binding-like beta-propeller repeat protein [Blastocatellia bacterium]|nr:PQQ-binding-like beta-propeller repeat protein [Blastocatellia bacterium]